MPRKAKAKVRRVKKARSTKRRTKKTVRRSLRVKRGHRKGKWYRKFKGHGKGIYKLRKSQGLKWSQYLDIAQFLLLPHISYYHVNLAACQILHDEEHGTATFNNGARPTDDFMSKSVSFFRRLFLVQATDTMLAQNSMFNKDVVVSELNHWSAWNPFLGPSTLGSWFMNMMNEYRFYKYVGVQVKWKPNVKYTTSYWEDQFNAQFPPKIAPASPDNPNSIAIADGTGAGFFNPSLTSDISQFELDNIFKMSGSEVANDYTSLCTAFKAPPKFRLWVNFSKQGYSTYTNMPEAMFNNIPNADYTKVLHDFRYKVKRVYDNYGQRQDAGKIRCFDLSKPFKFYVRPTSTRPVYESPDEQTQATNTRGTDSQLQLDIYRTYPDANAMITTPKRFPWCQIGFLYPYYVPYQSVFKDNKLGIINWNKTYILNSSDHQFVDPILFSTKLTCDSLDNGDVMFPFSSYYHDSEDGVWNPYNCEIFPVQFLKNLGRFKVTFYCKFRGRNVNRYIPNISNTGINGLLQQNFDYIGQEVFPWKSN